jgi:hypothetical protein
MRLGTTTARLHEVTVRAQNLNQGERVIECDESGARIMANDTDQAIEEKRSQFQRVTTEFCEMTWSKDLLVNRISGRV